MLKFYNSSKVLCYIHEFEYNQPVHLEIHPAMDCNHKCVWCRYKKTNDQLSLTYMIRILDKYPKVKGILLSGGGEPLNNPATVNLIKECANRGIKVGLNTNGGLLNEHNIPVIARYCSYCRISLDASDATIHAENHRSDDWDRIIYNIKQLAQHNVKELGISYLVTEKTVWGISHVPDLKLPVNYWHFKPLISGISESVKFEATIRLKKIENSVVTRWDRIEKDDICNNTIPCRISKLISMVGGDGKEYVCCEKAYVPAYERGTWTGDTTNCKSCRYNGYNEVLHSYYNGDMSREFL